MNLLSSLVGAKGCWESTWKCEPHSWVRGHSWKYRYWSHADVLMRGSKEEVSNNGSWTQRWENPCEIGDDMRRSHHLIFLDIIILKFYVHWCFVCMYVWVCCFLWNWSYRQLWATMWVLRIEPRSSGRVATALNHWAISPGSEPII